MNDRCGSFLIFSAKCIGILLTWASELLVTEGQVVLAFLLVDLSWEDSLLAHWAVCMHLRLYSLLPFSHIIGLGF